MITSRARCWFLCLLALVSPMGGAGGQQAHPFDVHDLWAMDRVSDPQLSPGGKWIVFGVSSLDEAANRRRSDLWIVAAGGGEPRQLTTHPASEFNARWGPDGSGVFFLSARSGDSQVWWISVSGGEARQVTGDPGQKPPVALAQTITQKIQGLDGVDAADGLDRGDPRRVAVG